LHLKLEFDRIKERGDDVKILYSDDRVIVCVKPAGVLSTDEPGGLPNLLRESLGEPEGVFRTVHRLDRAVSGLIVLARTSRAASDLSAQIREGVFEKEYMAIVHGEPPACGLLRDYLLRDKCRRMTFVAQKDAPGAQEAVLEYNVIHAGADKSLLRIRLLTGRTHQIRVQFSSRGYPLVGDRKYSEREDYCQIALWSCRLRFLHPRTGEEMVFYEEPPEAWPVIVE
jgi:23S rRNA pseudouridine1911/1915/1917 synthase